MTTLTGTSFVRSLEAPLGSPARPMRWDQLVEKFRDCTRYAAVALSQQQVDEVISLIDGLEHVAEVRDITAALRASE